MPQQEQHSIFDNLPLPEPVWKRTTIIGTLLLSQLVYLFFVVAATSFTLLNNGPDLKHISYLLLGASQLVLWLLSLVKRKTFGFIIAAMQYTIAAVIILSSFFITWNRDGVLVPSIILLAISAADLVMLSMPVAVAYYKIKQPEKLAIKYALAVVAAMVFVGLLLGASYL